METRLFRPWLSSEMTTWFVSSSSRRIRPKCFFKIITIPHFHNSTLYLLVLLCEILKYTLKYIPSSSLRKWSKKVGESRNFNAGQLPGWKLTLHETKLNLLPNDITNYKIYLYSFFAWHFVYWNMANVWSVVSLPPYPRLYFTTKSGEYVQNPQPWPCPAPNLNTPPGSLPLWNLNDLASPILLNYYIQ